MSDSPSDWELRKQRVHDEAQRRIKQLVAQLRAEGWDLALVVVSRRVDGEGMAACRGGSLVDADAARIGPALPGEARNLRYLADVIEKAHARGCYPEATEGWSKDVELVLPPDRRPS